MRATPGLIAMGLAAVVLVGATFADWYVVVIDNPLFNSQMRDHLGHVGHVSMTAWESHAPLAGLLVGVAAGSVILSAVGTAKPASRVALAGGSVLAALVAVSVIVAQLARGRVQEIAGFTVTIAYAPAFFVGAAAAAALVVASGVNLWLSQAEE